MTTQGKNISYLRASLHANAWLRHIASRARAQERMLPGCLHTPSTPATRGYGAHAHTPAVTSPLDLFLGHVVPSCTPTASTHTHADTSLNHTWVFVPVPLSCQPSPAPFILQHDQIPGCQPPHCLPLWATHKHQHHNNVRISYVSSKHPHQSSSFVSAIPSMR